MSSVHPILSNNSFSKFGSVNNEEPPASSTMTLNENPYDEFNKKNKTAYLCGILKAFKSYVSDLLKIKNPTLREFMAELFGTFMFISFSLASVAQFKLSGKKDFLSVNVSFGFGLAMSIITVGKVSGGHLNPAVSFSMLLLGRMSLFRFFVYTIAQFIGAFLAALSVFLVYLHSLQKYPTGLYSLDTAGIFGTYPADPADPDSSFPMFFDQFFATSLFIISILSITDKRNSDMPHPVVAVLIGLLLLIIGTSFGYNCGFAVNPARDFSPRIFSAMAGWGSEPFTAGNYFFWIPILGPMLGSAFGTMLYHFFIGNNWSDDGFQQFN